MKEKKHEIIEELQEIAPGLVDLEHNEPFKVPHNYFKQLPDRVFEQIKTEEFQPSLWGRIEHAIVDTILLIRRPQYAIAFASLALVIVAGIFLSKPASDTLLLSDISADEAFEYVMANIDDYDPNELYALGAPSSMQIGGLDDMPAEDLGQAIDVLLDGLDTESLEELF